MSSVAANLSLCQNLFLKGLRSYWSSKRHPVERPSRHWSPVLAGHKLVAVYTSRRTAINRRHKTDEKMPTNLYIRFRLRDSMDVCYATEFVLQSAWKTIWPENRHPDPGRRIKPTAAGHKDCTVSCISNALRRRDPTARQTDIRIATVSVPAFRTEWASREIFSHH